jgi:hypothetical protein
MRTTLTTFDGFPRSDIDVAQSTNACLRYETSTDAGQSEQRERAS